MTAPAPRRYTAEELYYAAEHARPLKWQDAAGEHEIDLEELLYSAAEDASRLEQIEQGIKAAFLAGFAAGFANSCEGFNGECAFRGLIPFEPDPVDLADYEELNARAIELAEAFSSFAGRREEK